MIKDDDLDLWIISSDIPIYRCTIPILKRTAPFPTQQMYHTNKIHIDTISRFDAKKNITASTLFGGKFCKASPLKEGNVILRCTLKLTEVRVALACYLNRRTRLYKNYNFFVKRILTYSQ